MASSPGSRPAVEGDLAVGLSGHLVAGVVGPCVVTGADHDGVAVGFSAVCPAFGVVQVGHAGWCVAALDFAAAGFDGLGDPLGLAVEAVLAAEVEDLGLGVEDGGDDPGLTRQPAGGAGADGLAGVQP